MHDVGKEQDGVICLALYAEFDADHRHPFVEHGSPLNPSHGSAPEQPFKKSLWAMILKQGSCLLTPFVPVLAQIGNGFLKKHAFSFAFLCLHFQLDAEVP